MEQLYSSILFSYLHFVSVTEGTMKARTDFQTCLYELFFVYFCHIYTHKFISIIPNMHLNAYQLGFYWFSKNNRDLMN